MFGWLFSSDNSATIGASGLLITTIGFALTAWALRLTYLQAREAKKAADSAETAAGAAKTAIGNFQFKLDRYAAYRDLSEAEFAMDACKHHLEDEPAWRHASDSYDAARRALIRICQFPDALPADLADRLRQISDHMRQFCDKVDAANAKKGAYPDRSKVSSAIRDNYETLAAAKLYFEKDLAK